MQPRLAKSDGEAQGSAEAYSFGSYRLDLNRQAFFREGEPLTLRPKSFDVLRHLLENAGRVVSREELFDAVWPGLVVTDDSLTQCLIDIRKTLGDEERTLIRTIPRRGYLFDVDVRVEGPLSDRPASASPSTSGKRGLPSSWTLAALLVLAGAVAATWWRIDVQERKGSELSTEWQPQPATIAVLPFVDMSETGDQQYLAEGIAEEILNLLAQSPSLTVIARTSSFSFRDANADIATIARQLDVAHVLEGSVRKTGDRVRVTAQLVDGRTAAHIWSQTHDERLLDVFAMQDRVAQGVAEALEVKLTRDPLAGESKVSHTPDPQAWEIYLRGRLFYNRRGEGDIMRAQRNFEEALAIDPEFADAWVSLSATMRLRLAGESATDEERLTSGEALPMIRYALERALAIDPDHAEALWRYSYFTGRVDKDVDKTIELRRQAAELGHNHAMVQGMMGGFAVQTAHPGLALPFLRRAATLDPRSFAHQAGLGHALWFAGHLAEAERALMRAVELNPTGSDDQRAQLAWVKLSQNELTSAAELAESLRPGPDRDLTLVILNHLQGQTDLVDEAMARLRALPEEEVAGHLAQAHAMLGEKDEAFRWLSIATDSIANSSPGGMARRAVGILRWSPFLASLHDDQRWEGWSSVTSQLFLSELDGRVLSMLKAHLASHPELYGPIGARAGPR